MVQAALQQSAGTRQNISVVRPAFELGHVFKAAELPEDMRRLAGWFYFDDDRDGTMCLAKKNSCWKICSA